MNNPQMIAHRVLELILSDCRYWTGKDERLRACVANLYASAKETIEKSETEATAASSKKPLLQYYYRVAGCPAKDSGINCICWHNLGEGPVPSARPWDKAFGWRCVPDADHIEDKRGMVETDVSALVEALEKIDAMPHYDYPLRDGFRKSLHTRYEHILQLASEALAAYRKQGGES